LQGEFGENHVYRARSTVLLTLFEEVARIARNAVAEELQERGLLDPVVACYLDELRDLLIARKSQLSQLDREVEMVTHFDFPALQDLDYRADPRLAYLPEGHRIVVSHTDTQRTDLRKYFAQYGDDIEGFSHFVQRNDSHLSAVLYRGVRFADSFTGIGTDALHGEELSEVEAAPSVSTSISNRRSLQGLAASIIWWATLLN